MRFVTRVFVAVLALGCATDAAAAPWGTRLLLTGNFARQAVWVVEPVPGGMKVGVPAGQSRNMGRTMIPVCRNGRDYKASAIQIRGERKQKFLAGVCQDARDHAVYVVPRGQHWISRDRCGDRAYAFVSLTVDRKGKVRCFGYDREPDPEPGVLLE